MASGSASSVLRHVRALFGAGAAGAATDAQLLERFRSRDVGGDPRAAEAEAAFAVLVARHGPMVLGVCRRALGDEHDADDAFQATFLVLARRAGAVRVEGSLGRWLYGVSRRVALRARADAARRAARERPGAGPAVGSESVVSPFDPERAERLAALDEEVARLPEPFRAAVLLCDLAGLTHEAAARQLGCPVGTVESRLSRGRKRLRERLDRRGLAPAVVSPGLAPPSVPEALSTMTIRAATSHATVAGSVPAAVAALIEGVIKGMAWTKLKALTMGVGAVAVLGGLGAFAGHGLTADEPRPPTRPPARTEPSEAPATPATTPAPVPGLQPPARIQLGDALTIEVLEALPGRPISGQRIVRNDGTVSLGFYGDLQVAGLTRDQIKVRVIERLKKWLSDERLGLVDEDAEGKLVKVAPVDSGRVFVDDSPSGLPTAGNLPTAKMDEKLARVLDELAWLRTHLPPPKAQTAQNAPIGLQPPAPLKPGDRLRIEVLQALPGRPLSGERVVRPDGTISLGYYGDLLVAGLTRHEIKVKLVEHMARFLNDDALGLRDEVEPGKFVRIAPADSGRVFVDDAPSDLPTAGNLRTAKMDEKLARVLDELAWFRAHQAKSAAYPAPGNPRLATRPESEKTRKDHDRRLDEIERKLDRLIQAVEGRKPNEGR